MLRTRLFKFFGFLALIFGLLYAFIGVQVIRKQVIQRAENQVRSDLNAAWSVLNGEMNTIETVLKLIVDNSGFREQCSDGQFDDGELRRHLEGIRTRFNLDFLSILTPNGRVVLRSAPPYKVGDYFPADALIQKALKGQGVAGVTLFDPQTLDREYGDLSRRAFLEFEETPFARGSRKNNESRGMVLMSAVPVVYNNNVVAAVYGGVMMNRNKKIVDKIHETIYRNEKYKGTSTGSVTIFLNDCRITTTVRKDNGNRALGTRVSKEVAESVLDNGEPWLGRAFVVKDWYLTAYDPIYTVNNRIVGMLYVGILEQPFVDIVRMMIGRYALLSFAGLLVTLIAAYFLAARVAKPIHALAEASHTMREGQHPGRVEFKKCSTETRTLIDAFNNMADKLVERERKLKEANTSLVAVNKSYMETLGFISHELKTPLGSIMNYTFMLGEDKFGELNEKQKRAVKNIDLNTKRITEMVRHYLNLSRIENNELNPVLADVRINDEIVGSLIELMKLAAEEKSVTIQNNIPDECTVHADYNMTHEVFENLISNAIKYGNKDGCVTIDSQISDAVIEFRVRNTGDGIPEEYRNTIFDKFVRVNGMGMKKKGTGLGLFITQHIVKSHGGTISVNSEEGKWTEFVFTLPASKERLKRHEQRTLENC
ncbi:MAG: HAMP domain-containing protein [Chitinivibrionales bacterium]|nr:HAMP domain-containing protein [Chitinivibrionales bacterium]